MNDPGQPFSLAPGEGRVLPTPAGGQVTLKVRAVESSGRVSLAEFEVPAGAGPRPHVHEESDECIYVLHGELRVQIGDEAHDATAGSCVFIPRGLTHCFRNVGEERASLLAVYTPGGIEQFFENFAQATPKTGGMRHPAATRCDALDEPDRGHPQADLPPVVSFLLTPGRR